MTDRGAAMAASVARAARIFGVDEEGARLVATAHALAMETRVTSLPDDHHPAYLHPGRTILVLLRDAGVTDGEVLAAACLVESEDEDLRVDVPKVRELVGNDVAELVRAVPLPTDDALAEMLVTSSRGIRLIAVAERLDQLRHAHLRDAGSTWMGAVFAQAVGVYLPVAERTDETLGRRYRHWSKTFEKRLGGPT